MKQLIQNKSNGLEVPVHVIPNWAELERVRPDSRDNNQLIQELGLQNKLVILHAGNIGHPTDVETVIEGLRQLDDRFHFLFIGTGVKRRLLERAVAENGLTNLTLLDPLPRDQQSVFLNAADVGLVSLVNGMYGAAMPSKAYNLLAAAKPILAITESGSELAQVIDEEEIGWHVRSGDSSEFVSKLNDIYHQRSRFRDMGARARIAAEEKYSLAVALEKYRRVLN